MARFEVLGLDADCELISSLARQLAAYGPDSSRIRASVYYFGGTAEKGGILNVLRHIAPAATGRGGSGSSPPRLITHLTYANMGMYQRMKRLTWLADSRSNVKSFPARVQDEIGYALFTLRT